MHGMKYGYEQVKAFRIFIEKEMVKHYWLLYVFGMVRLFGI